jgi:FkbM family methyltransferase
MKTGIKSSIRRLTDYINCRSITIRTIARNRADKKLEPEVYVLHKFISPGAICLDIGAAYGRFALKISRLAGNSGRVYCFEPGNISYKVLSGIVSYYNLKNVITVKMAVTDKKGVSELNIPFKRNKRLGLSMAYLKTVPFYEHLGIRVERIASTTLDSYCSEMGIQRVDFIKCDVEGSELLVFRGARKLLQLYKPVVLCEINELALKEKHNSQPNQIYDFFSRMHYQAFKLRGEVFQKVDCLEADDNYFFIHSQAKLLSKIRRGNEQ